MKPATGVFLVLFVLTLLTGRNASDCGLEYQGCSSGRDRRDILFPGDDDYDINPITKYLTPEQIDQLNDIDSIEDVVRAFSNESTGVEAPILSARILPMQLATRSGHQGPVGQARSEYNPRHRGLKNRMSTGGAAGSGSGKMQAITVYSPAVKQAVPAKCKPTLQPVPLKKPDDLTMMYWPYCVQLERCSGCCINDRQQSCQPTKTELVPFNVTRFLINGMVRSGSEILHLERHVECRCGCIVKATDCNPLQEYSPRECRCNCGNIDEKRKCLSEPNKLWDNKDCKCRCREYPPEGCTTGLYFDLNTCVCTARPETRHRVVDNSYKLEKRRRRWQNRTSYSVVPTLT